jgi:hypothetical protein
MSSSRFFRALNTLVRKIGSKGRFKRWLAGLCRRREYPGKEQGCECQSGIMQGPHGGPLWDWLGHQSRRRNDWFNQARWHSARDSGGPLFVIFGPDFGREGLMSKTCMQALSAAMAVLALGLGAGASLAQQPTDAQKSAIRNNCRSDYMAHCSSVTPGGIEALQCLQRNSASLSSACRGAVAAITPRAAPAAAPPAQPAAAPAAAPTAAAPAGPSAAPPPPAHRPPTPAAAPTVQRAASLPRQPSSAQRAAIRQACEADFMSRCAGVQPGGAQALQCLQGHAPELSASCRTALAALGSAAAASVAVAAPPPVAEPAIGPIGPLPVRFRLEILNICRAEQMQFCSGVPAGGGRIIDCLVANQASISPGCRRALVWASR